MSVITVIVLIFFLLGAVDWLLGNRFGIGKEFEKGFSLFSSMVLSMLGMIVISPAIGVWLTPFFEKFYSVFGIDPSVIPASLFANDMGGMQLAQVVSKNEEIGLFNAFVTSSMMGCVISFTIPFSLSIVKKEQYDELFFGLLCGIATIPVGCFVGGLCCGIDISVLIINLLPLIIFALLVGVALVFVPKICIQCFKIFGYFVKTVAVIGLLCATFTFLTKIQINPYFDTLENSAFICANGCVTLAGMLPFMYIVSKLLNKPFEKFGKILGINTVAASSFLNTIVTNVSTFSVMDKMDKKGTVLNSAFAVSAAFSFGGHMALTLAYNGDYVFPMIIGKVVAGVCGVLLAILLYEKKGESKSSENNITVVA